MKLFSSPFEKLSSQSLQNIETATRVTAESVSPGGALFGKIEEMIGYLKKIEKNTSVYKSPLTGLDKATLKLIGPAAQGIAQAFKIIIDSINAAPSGEQMEKKINSVVKGISAVVGLGKAIFKFAAMLALSLPLLIIGMVALPLAAFMILAVASIFFLIQAMGIDRTIKKVATGLAIAGLAFITLSGGLAVSYLIIESTFGGVGNGAIASMGVFLAVLVLGTAIVFSIAGLLSPLIQRGAIAIGLSSLPLLILAASFAIFRTAVPPTSEGWTTIAQVGATVTGLGVLMAAAGAAAVLIIPGAAAMVISGLALLLVSAGFAAIAAVMKPGKFDYLLADSGHVTEGFLGFGAGRMMSNMEWAILSLARSFTLPVKSIASMYAAAPALIMSGLALISISKGIEKFQSMQIDYETLPGQIDKVTTVLADSFAKVGMKYPGGGAGLIGAMFGSGSDTSVVAQGISAVSGMGRALTGIATGVQEMALLRFPTKWDKNGNPIAFRQLKDEDFDAVTRNTQKIVVALSSTFGKIGAMPEAADPWGWFGNSKVEEGIEIVQKMSDPLVKLSEFIKTFSQQEIDVKGTVDKTKQIIGAMTAVFVEAGKSMTVDQIEAAAEAYEDMADAMEDMADSMQDWTKGVNSLDLKKVTEVRKLYEGLAYLAKNDGETAIEKMGSSLVEALNHLSELLEKAGDKKGSFLDGLLPGGGETAPPKKPGTGAEVPGKENNKSESSAISTAELKKLAQILQSGIDVRVVNDRF